MPSVLATLVAVAVAAVLLRVAIERLASGEELMHPGPTQSMRTVRDEIEELRDTLSEVRDRSAVGDGT